MSQPRGLFLNTIKAQCSIYESGRMAFECLRQSDRYALDYLEIDAQTPQFGIYDFYLLNYHHATMSWLDTRSLRQLPGKKFTLVLETLPNNPFPLCPPTISTHIWHWTPQWISRTSGSTHFPDRWKYRHNYHFMLIEVCRLSAVSALPHQARDLN